MGASLILRHGEIVVEPGNPVRAEGVAVLGDRIAAAGSDAEVMAWAGPETQVVELEGRTVTPGFNDAHIHLVQHGLNMLRWVDLSGCVSIEQIIERVKEQADRTPPGVWVLGRGFDQERLREKRFPTARDMEAAGKKHPVFLTRICLHAGVVNRPALERIDPAFLKAADPGQYDWESGYFSENALNAVWSALPEPSPEEMVAAVEAASRTAIETGVTSAQCLIASAAEVAALREARRRGSLQTRVTLQYPLALFPQIKAAGLATGFGDEVLKIGAIKIFTDGSLGARTAALSRPYSDAPGSQGMLFFTDDKLCRTVREIHESGFQTAIHAIGDAAVGQVMDAYEAALGTAPDANLQSRLRIEHASVLGPGLLERMARLKIVAAVQPQFVASDFWTVERVGEERLRYTYPFRSMLAKGIPIAFSSDCPVERLDAFETLARAMARDERSSQERVSLEDGLCAYTVGAAFADFEEKRKGAVRPGMLADLVILPKGFLAMAASRVERTRPEGVVWGGKWAMKLARGA
ncbi:MAG: amidohydrolase [Armatimonadetes bacterium]|nr:amidohydrolase [Armatimonadota bacterium]